MTGDQLKRWRTNRGLTQEQLASHLGEPWTRDMVANREANRASFPEDIQSQLAAIDATLSRPPAAAPSSAGVRLAGNDRQYWSTHGEPIAAAYALAQGVNFCFFRLDSPTPKDEVTGHPLANLYQMARDPRSGRVVPHCTHIDLDTATMTARCTKVRDNLSLAFVEQLNTRLAPAREALANPVAMPIAPSPDFFQSPA